MSTPADLVVVNTSPLLALDACGQIDLLRSLYQQVVVPDVVDNELSVGKTRPLLPGGLTAAHRGWIQVRALSNPVKASLLAKLDPGEAAVIQLALELGTTQVLIDERSRSDVNATGRGGEPEQGQDDAFGHGPPLRAPNGRG